MLKAFYVGDLVPDNAKFVEARTVNELIEIECSCENTCYRSVDIIQYIYELPDDSEKGQEGFLHD